MHLLRVKSTKRIFLLGYLVVALLLVQGWRLHMHIYDHDQTPSHYTHQLQTHSAFDAGDGEHPDEATEIDLSLDAFLKKLSSGTLSIAMIIAVLILMPRRLGVQISRRRDRPDALITLPVNLRPPLRAPPL